MEVIEFINLKIKMDKLPYYYTHLVEEEIGQVLEGESPDDFLTTRPLMEIQKDNIIVLYYKIGIRIIPKDWEDYI